METKKYRREGNKLCIHDEFKANAHLIAAAPELLNECKNALAYYRQRGPSFELVAARLEKIIAKAEVR